MVVSTWATALALASLAHAIPTLEISRPVSALSAQWSYLGAWNTTLTETTEPSAHAFSPERQRQLSGADEGRTLAIFETKCKSATLHGEVEDLDDALFFGPPGGNDNRPRFKLTGDNGDLGIIEADSSGTCRIAIHAGHVPESPTLFMRGATVKTEIQTEATIAEDVETRAELFILSEERRLNPFFTYEGKWKIEDTHIGDGTFNDTGVSTVVGTRSSVTIHVPPGTSFVELGGTVGPQYGSAIVSVDGEGEEVVHAQDPFTWPNTSLWMSSLDPAVNHTITISTPQQPNNVAKSKVGLHGVTFYSSEWHHSCSESHNPKRCRYIRFKRSFGDHWIWFAVVFFLFELLKGLAWLGLGGIILAFLRSLWRRIRGKKTGEEEPLLGEHAAEETEAQPEHGAAQV